MQREVSADEKATSATTACANCKMPIEGGHDAVEKGGRTYCCDGCAYGGPCVC
jgi:hypothetical protein